eukprot:scaffold167381_cov32-Tisochrysis_lutea.AAC.3
MCGAGAERPRRSDRVVRARKMYFSSKRESSCSVELLRDRSPSTATEPLPRDGRVRGSAVKYVARNAS